MTFPTKLEIVTPQMNKRVFIEMTKAGRAPPTQRLVKSTLKKMFGDTVENYQSTSINPVLRITAVGVSNRSTPLNLQQIK